MIKDEVTQKVMDNFEHTVEELHELVKDGLLSAPDDMSYEKRLKNFIGIMSTFLVKQVKTSSELAADLTLNKIKQEIERLWGETTVCCGSCTRLKELLEESS